MTSFIGENSAQSVIVDQMTARDEERDLILGLVSHELRTSLAAITLSSMMILRGGAAPGSAQSASSRILASARRMSGIISDLLDLNTARWGAGIALRPEPVDAHEVCQRMVDELGTANPGRDIRLLQIGDGNGCWDGNRLEQIVCNLVSNALQYGAQGAPITITSWGDGDYWSLSVHNLGRVISPADLPRLYEPFQRGTDIDSRQYKGRNLGIGLFIVRQLVLGHGGTIDAVSNETEGTRFVVKLPRGLPR